jgi:uncharacterized protein
MPEDLQRRIDAFLNGSPHAVVGASTNREKYGNKVLRVYQQNKRPVYPINPFGGVIEGLESFKSLTDLVKAKQGAGSPTTPFAVHAVSIITPPAITERVVEECGQLGIKHLWMQPGAESGKAVARAEELGMNVIAGGPCILVVLGYSER